MRRGAAAALLLLCALACQAGKEQSIAPETLYASGREALQHDDFAAAEKIAQEGQTKFAAQRYWREMFAILEAEAAPTRAQSILKRTPATGLPVPKVRRLIVGADRSDDAYRAADALAAQVAPELRAEIAMRRIPYAKDWRGCADEAIRTAKQPWLLARAYWLLAYKEGGASQWTPAIEHSTLAVKYARASQAKRTEFGALAVLGWCYLQVGDLDQAMANLRPVAAQTAFPSPEHTALVQLAELYVRRTEYDKAVPYATKALAVARQMNTPKDLANSFHQLTRLEFELGHYEAAKRWNDQAIAIRPKTDIDGTLDDRLNEARILDASGNPARALQVLDSVLAAKPNAVTQWRAQGLKAHIYGKLGRLDEAARMYEATLGTGAKARENVHGSDASFEFERNFFSFYDGYIDLMLSQHRVADALAIAERSRARALREAIGLASDKRIDPVSLARAKNATILCYWLGEKRSLLWTVTPRGIDVATLPPDEEIDRAADAYRAELQSRHSLATSTRGVQLYEMLVAPAKIAPASRVIILPDSHLNALSFETFIVPALPRHYWIDDVTISYSPSLHLLDSTPAWKGVRDASVLVLGNVPGEGREFPPLARAGAEIIDVARHFDPSRRVIVSGTAATPESYAAAQPRNFDFIHFAAHATANMHTPLDSSVILAPGPNGFRLSGYDIVKVGLAAQLVTVSSCNSAGQRSYAGEGLVGLAWAFLRAGASRVVAAQWEVSDSAAPKVMDLMYGAIGDGVEPAEALRRAKLNLLHSDTVYEKPLYWAPFVVYGVL